MKNLGRLSAIIPSFDINQHVHTDDIQIYMSLCVFNDSIGVVFRISKNTYPKHLRHAFIISVTCVELEESLSLELAKHIAVAWSVEC